MLEVTPAHVEAMYECLRAFEPWKSLKLPPADEVAFHVRNRRDVFGEWVNNGGEHEILISSLLIGSFQRLAQVVGHEMLHLAQREMGTENSSQHNKDWQRLARIACRKMVWDERAF